MKSAVRVPTLLTALLAMLLALAVAGLPGCAAQTAGEAMTPQELVDEARTLAPAITVADARARQEAGGVVLIDVREPNEYKLGHLGGALNIPRGTLEFTVTGEVPDKSAPVVVYCKTGKRAALAAATLKRMGYTNVVNMDGGWEAWLKAGYPAG